MTSTAVPIPHPVPSPSEARQPRRRHRRRTLRLLAVTLMSLVAAIGPTPQPAGAFEEISIPIEYFGLWGGGYCAGVQGFVTVHTDYRVYVRGDTTSLRLNSSNDCNIHSSANPGILAIQLRLVKASTGTLCHPSIHRENTTVTSLVYAQNNTAWRTQCGAGWYNIKIVGRIMREGNPVRHTITSAGFYLEP